MSKLVLDFMVPAQYDRQTISEIIRAICNQANSHAEGRLAARYNAQSTIPSSVAGAVSDFVPNNNATVINGTVTGTLVGNYIVTGWICTVGSPTNATWKEVRVLTP